MRTHLRHSGPATLARLQYPAVERLFLTDSPDRTARIGRVLGSLALPGDIFLLVGDLGSGKTTFVRALADGLGVPAGRVASPTFVCIAEHPGRVPLVHVDAYRLRSPDDLDSAGWDRVLGRLDDIVLAVEWPQRLPVPLDDRPHVRARLEHAGPSSRRIALTLPESWRDRPNFEDLASLAATRCPVTGQWVSPDAPTWPFANERARLADLYGWFEEQHRIPSAQSPPDQRDPPDA